MSSAGEQATARVPANEGEKSIDSDLPQIDLWQDFKDATRYLIFNPEANHIIMPLLVVIESLALKWIIYNVPYTEIDYQAYMEQIWTIQSGERDYSMIEGSTGPLVYPAGHVWIYRIMEKITSGMDNLKAGQHIFRHLYIGTMILQMICYVMLEIPPWCVVLASLSKRLHSIYVLRLFNDCFTTFFMTLTVLLLLISARFQRRFICLPASITYAIAISIKMNALTYLPAVLLSIFLLTGGQILETLLCIVIIDGWQLFIARDFLKDYAPEYWTTAFNFGRKFMYKWTVNWQFLDEDVFQNELFHRTLLVSHALVLLLFAFTRFTTPLQVKSGLKSLIHPFSRVTRSFVPSPKSIGYALIMTNFVGIVFARSLHYQFLSWYHWNLPIIIHWSGLPMYLGIPWYLAHEWCWNSYPPNDIASGLLYLLNNVLLILAYLNYPVKVTSDKKEQ
ncbi:LAFE_0B09076g1_1 [Lachancea fermentati]|uniref:Dol-P-Man:Man(5)GlcNAc(2)-PP-Dol alpha-1,3-mannosyltransferase n=1 Tax=Lachancea fermentati TaxID=4955 RepID=A0A1G4M8A8_LACFM|nr:LAFE_0B09076g1_1 [Lachancea fermentati]